MREREREKQYDVATVIVADVTVAIMVRDIIVVGGSGTTSTPIAAPFPATFSAPYCVVVAIIVATGADCFANIKREREREIGPSQPHNSNDINSNFPPLLPSSRSPVALFHF